MEIFQTIAMYHHRETIASNEHALMKHEKGKRPTDRLGQRNVISLM